MKISRMTLISQLVPEQAGFFGRRLRADHTSATLLSQFSREGEDSSESPSDDVLGAVGQQDELMRDRVIHMIERLGGGFKWSSQHGLCELFAGTGPEPRPVFSSPGSFAACC